MTRRTDAAYKQGIRILGIDPGLNTTGYGLIEVDTHSPRVKVVEAGVVRGTKKQSLTLRVAEIHRGVSEVISAWQPDVLALEELYAHYKRPKTAILMGHARGVICLAAAQAGIPVQHYPATRIKSILSGNGHAPKSQVQESVKRELGLDEVPRPNDVSDALAIALCHSYLSRSQHNLAQLDQTKNGVVQR